MPLLFTIHTKLRDSFAKLGGSASVTTSMKTSAVEMNLNPHTASSLPVSSSPEIKTFNVRLIFRDIFSAELLRCDMEKVFLVGIKLRDGCWLPNLMDRVEEAGHQYVDA